MTIRQKFLSLLGLLVTLIILQTIVGIWTNARSNDRLQSMYGQRTQSLSKLGIMLDDSNVVRVRLLRATLAANPDAVKTELAEVGKLLSNVEQQWNAVEALAKADEEQKFVSAYKSSLSTYVQQREAWINALQSGDFDKAKAVASDKLTTEAFRNSRNAIRDLFGVEDQLASASFEAAQVDSKRAAWTSAITVIASLLLVIVATHFIVRPVINSIQDAVKIADHISQGNLTETIVATGKDEIARLLTALDRMQSRLRESVRTMQLSASELASQSQTLNDSSKKTHAQALTQSDAMNAAAAAIEELTVSIHVLSGNATDAHTSTERSGEEARKGVDVILSTTEQMQSLAATVHRASNTLQGLGSKSQQISQIVDVIREIADQTNLLALNAAIEAARAGEQGRGFAVVADEVRKLAERTGQSTQQIAKVINEVLSETGNAIHEMEDGVTKVQEGTRLAEAAGESIRHIVASTERVANMVTDISSAIREQTTAAQDIAKNVEHVAQSSEESITVSNANAASATTLHKLSQELNSVVEHFKLD
jgi:methyl-accepting chemotaxis protein